MAGVKLSATADDRQARLLLHRLVLKAVNPQPALDEIGAMLVSSAQQRIQEEEDPEGNPWPELAESTQNRRISKRRLRGDEHMLRVKGHLFNSITHRASRRDVQWGSNRKYAALQQMGGTRDMENAGARANPGRAFLGISAADEREMRQILHDYLNRAAA
ncbi:MAG TPA: phage virion morphogenesis protein [Longimicrobium sp.]|jgi:phage virion morphogenesis protein